MASGIETNLRLFRPKSLGGLLRLFAGNPGALLYAGGTCLAPALFRARGQSLHLPAKVIFLGQVPELRRISRSQRHLDIGAGLSLSRILSLGRNILPSLLHQALRAVATPSVRNLATLGGNLGGPLSGKGSLASLAVIGAQLELRSWGSSRWVAAGSFGSQVPEQGLKPGEILARVRIPLEDWDQVGFRKVGEGPLPALCFAAAARFPRGILEVFRFGLTAGALPLLRSVELEARMRGQRLPLSDKVVEVLLDELDRLLRGRLPADALGRYQLATSLRLMRRYLQSLGPSPG